jgi:hypothetical protein
MPIYATYSEIKVLIVRKYIYNSGVRLELFADFFHRFWIIDNPDRVVWLISACGESDTAKFPRQG